MGPPFPPSNVPSRRRRSPSTTGRGDTAKSTEVRAVANLQSLAPDSGVLDPALQPGRQKVVGVYEGAGFPRYALGADGYPLTYDIDGRILVGFGASGDRYEGWLSKPLPVVDSLLSNDIKVELDGKGYVREPYLREESGFGFFLRGQAAGRTSAVHTAADIPVSAYTRGPGWRDFVGVQTNTDVFFKIARLLLGGGAPSWLSNHEVPARQRHPGD